MGWFSNMFSKNDSNSEPKGNHWTCLPGELLAPVSGTNVKLQDVSDPVFSSGAMGVGLGIEPASLEKQVCYAPCKGTVVATTQSGHALGLQTSDGAEVLIHVGIDTVEMNGKGFTYFVQTGDVVQPGQALLEFDPETIHKCGFKSTVIMVVTNAQDLTSVAVKDHDAVTAGDTIIEFE